MRHTPVERRRAGRPHGLQHCQGNTVHVLGWPEGITESEPSFWAFLPALLMSAGELTLILYSLHLLIPRLPSLCCRKYLSATQHSQVFKRTALPPSNRNDERFCSVALAVKAVPYP